MDLGCHMFLGNNRQHMPVCVTMIYSEVRIFQYYKGTYFSQYYLRCVAGILLVLDMY